MIQSNVTRLGQAIVRAMRHLQILARFRTRCDLAGAALLWLLSLLSVSGCTSQKPDEPPAALPFEGVRLKLLVVDDPAMAGAVARFQGEWKAESGASLEVIQCSQAELLEAKQLSADAVIYPSYCLGVLDERKLLAPLSREFLADPRLDWPDVFEALRVRDVVRDGQALAVPLGSPVLVCYYRADLFRQFDRQPPRTWPEFVELAEFFGDRRHAGLAASQDDADWCAVMAPEQHHGDALLLLAWAAPYAKHPDYFSALFDLQTMTPRIDSPPFVRALSELKSIAGLIRHEATPGLVAEAFWQGRCAMAIGWASAAPANAGADDPLPAVEAGFFALPGGEEVYHPEAEKWEKRPQGSQRVPLLNVAGRVGSVAKSSSHASAACQLLAMLCGTQWSSQIASASPATTLFRASHLKAPRQWTEKAMDQSSASRYAEVVQASLSQQDYLAALPFAGRDEYLAALDAAVQSALAEEQTPAAALAACSQQWEQITERLGRQRQREAYRRSVEFGP
jgi:multiple sugar transport system substrate-binding protein